MLENMFLICTFDIHVYIYIYLLQLNDILDIVRACIQLCQRNSPRLDPDESESLWFQLLDSYAQYLPPIYFIKIFFLPPVCFFPQMLPISDSQFKHLFLLHLR